MEGVPLGGLLELFFAISNKLPTPDQWNTQSHGHIFGHDRGSCDFMTAIGEITRKYRKFTITILHNRGNDH
jgi:hypothetical protein